MKSATVSQINSLIKLASVLAESYATSLLDDESHEGKEETLGSHEELTRKIESVSRYVSDLEKSSDARRGDLSKLVLDVQERMKLVCDVQERVTKLYKETQNQDARQASLEERIAKLESNTAHYGATMVTYAKLNKDDSERSIQIAGEVLKLTGEFVEMKGEVSQALQLSRNAASREEYRAVKKKTEGLSKDISHIYLTLIPDTTMPSHRRAAALPTPPQTTKP